VVVMRGVVVVLAAHVVHRHDLAVVLVVRGARRVVVREGGCD
jgi:hypothetical protein